MFFRKLQKLNGLTYPKSLKICYCNIDSRNPWKEMRHSPLLTQEICGRSVSVQRVQVQATKTSTEPSPKKEVQSSCGCCSRVYLSILVGGSLRYGVEFTQCTWLHPFINFNTSMRQQATSPFAETFYKLMVNSYFGKTMEVDIIFLA